MLTRFGRVSKPSLFLLAILLLAVVAGLVTPGGTGDAIEIGAWVAIVILLLLEVGVRTTPWFGNYYGDERDESERAAGRNEPPVRSPGRHLGTHLSSREED
jgi:hypothetical protein